MMAAALGKKPPNREANLLLSRFALFIDRMSSALTGKKRILTKDAIKVALSKTYWDNGKIRKALPDFSFTPLPLSIENACKKYVKAVSEGLLLK